MLIRLFSFFPFFLVKLLSVPAFTPVDLMERLENPIFFSVPDVLLSLLVG
jgi:hypothetical protein